MSSPSEPDACLPTEALSRPPGESTISRVLDVPPSPVAGYQVWQDLFFLHWTLPPEVVAPLLPPGLALDTHGGHAWIGLVPFRMRNVRPWWSPPIPGISHFLETNVRTYVTHKNGNPGVYFFSLEAANRIAVTAARWGWHLPYHYARMSLTREHQRVDYTSHRTPHRPDSPFLKMTALIEGPLPEPHSDGVSGKASPGSLEEFLAERYLLYTPGADGRLLRGQVLHTPYPLYHCHVEHLSQSLTTALGLPCPGLPRHALYSPGVNVRVCSLQPV